MYEMYEDVMGKKEQTKQNWPRMKTVDLILHPKLPFCFGFKVQHKTSLIVLM